MVTARRDPGGMVTLPASGYITRIRTPLPGWTLRAAKSSENEDPLGYARTSRL